MKMKSKRKGMLLDEMVKQLKWIAEHGGDQAGYVARYGRATDPNKYGNGGEAIYLADVAELQRIQKLYWSA